jgi:hypothetical protein
VRSLLCAVLWVAGGCSSPPELRVVPGEVGQGGGTPLRIEGHDFVGHGPAAVYVGVDGAKAIVIESQWLVTAVSPPTEQLGEVDVRVSFGDGTSVDLPAAVRIVEETGVVLRPALGG